ncbi:MAG: argininosuccinate synthase [Planctomycetia bacterium]|nr:argininosuccinate synthase [Planctomycetia bacterium]
MSKAVLAYTGALDNLICIHWLRTVKNIKVVTFSGNFGQPEFLEEVGERAVEAGATAAHIGDIRERFVREFCFQALRAGARYESGYVLSSALSRPPLAQELVRVARDEGCEFVAHGCRGIGNDQVRLETYLQTLAPDLRIVAPLFELGLKTPEDDEAYAKRWGLPRSVNRQLRYNVDQNLWGVALQLGPRADLWMEPPDDTYIMTRRISDAPDKPRYVEIGFQQGLPVSLDNERHPPLEMVDILNRLGAQYAIGRLDVIEDRISGLKAREIYEAPAAHLLHQAHTALEELTLDKDVFQFRDVTARRYADLVYRGKWFTPFREALDAWFEVIEKPVTGTVKLKLLGGTSLVVGRQSPHSLYRSDMLSFDGDVERTMRRRRHAPDSEHGSRPPTSRRD